MPQLKEQFAGVAKHGFWILCGVTVITALGVSFWSTSKLNAEREEKTQEIKGGITTVRNISSELPTHPNAKTRSEMEELLTNLQQDVLDAWEMQYEHQKEILVWPAEELGQDVVEAFSKFEPIELYFDEYPVPKEMEVAPGLLTRYRDYIAEVLPDLAKIAGAEWTADIKNPASSGGMGGYGGAMGGAMGGETGGYGGAMGGEMGGYGGGEMGGYGGAGAAGAALAPLKDPPLVKWSTSSQEEVMSNLFPWRGRTPTTLEVLYSQENLWVLEQLMRVIDSTNGEARQPFQAVVHEIEEIAIGKSAAGGAGAQSSGGYGGGMGGMSDMYGTDYAGGESAGGEGLGLGGGLGGETAALPDPAENRYVDVNYEPIDATTLRSSMASADPEDAYLAVAKRIPVKLRVKMDQRKIPALVAECGNARLMIEVRQVRVNPSTRAGGGYGGAGGGGGGYGGGGGGYPGGGGGYPGGGGGGYPGGGGGEMGGGYGGEAAGEGFGGGEGGMYGGATASREEFPNDVPVEVYGVVYIFNPPDMEKLGIEQVDETTEIEGDAGPTTDQAPEDFDPQPLSDEGDDAQDLDDADARQPSPNGSAPAEPNNGAAAPQPAPPTGATPPGPAGDPNAPPDATAAPDPGAAPGPPNPAGGGNGGAASGGGN